MTVDNVVENVATAYGKGLLRRRQQSKTQLIISSISTDLDTTEPSSKHYYLRDSYYTVRQTNRSRKRNPNSTQVLSFELRNDISSPLVYVSTPQRLDQNTTGLFVISTTKAFSAYFAQLLRNKTNYHQLQLHPHSTTTALVPNQHNIPNGKQNNLVHKTYKCLVCIQASDTQQCSSRTLTQELQKLQTFVQNQTIVTHYLEPSIRAPKFFSSYQKDSSWAKCLLRIKAINTTSILLVKDGTQKSTHLASQLWGSIGR